MNNNINELSRFVHRQRNYFLLRSTSVRSYLIILPYPNIVYSDQTVLTRAGTALFAKYLKASLWGTNVFKIQFEFVGSNIIAIRIAIVRSYPYTHNILFVGQW